MITIITFMIVIVTVMTMKVMIKIMIAPEPVITEIVEPTFRRNTHQYNNKRAINNDINGIANHIDHRDL